MRNLILIALLAVAGCPPTLVFCTDIDVDCGADLFYGYCDVDGGKHDGRYTINLETGAWWDCDVWADCYEEAEYDVCMRDAMGY